MTQFFGDFKEEQIDCEEYLALGFSPGSMPLKHRWRNNGLSADFMGDYLTTFFPSNSKDNKLNEIDKQIEIKGAVSYIANELLENAMKFNDEASNYPITIRLILHSDHIIFHLINSMPFQNVSKFQAYIRELSSCSDPQDLYVKQLERNAQEEDGMTSSLGLLTMINDYMAKLGWKIEIIEQEPKLVIVNTMVKISV